MMTKRRPNKNLPQPNPQPSEPSSQQPKPNPQPPEPSSQQPEPDPQSPEPSSQQPEPDPQSPEPSSGLALSRPNPVIPAQAGIHTADPEREKMGENGREIQKSSLTFRQQAALTVIAATPTVAQAARQSGIGERTLYRWLEDPDFRAELVRLREESANLARQELQGLMLRSVSVIAEAMDDPDKAVRLRAARYAMSFAARIGEVEKLRKEIQEVEAALPIWTAHHTLK